MAAGVHQARRRRTVRVKRQFSGEMRAGPGAPARWMLDGHRLADRPGPKQLLHPDHLGVVAPVVGDLQRHAGSRGTPRSSAGGLRDAHRHRLLAEDVLPGLRRREHVLAVPVVLRGDVDPPSTSGSASSSARLAPTSAAP